MLITGMISPPPAPWTTQQTRWMWLGSVGLTLRTTLPDFPREAWPPGWAVLQEQTLGHTPWHRNTAIIFIRFRADIYLTYLLCTLRGSRPYCRFWILHPHPISQILTHTHTPLLLSVLAESRHLPWNLIKTALSDPVSSQPLSASHEKALAHPLHSPNWMHQSRLRSSGVIFTLCSNPSFSSCRVPPAGSHHHIHTPPLMSVGCLHS